MEFSNISGSYPYPKQTSSPEEFLLNLDEPLLFWTACLIELYLPPEESFKMMLGIYVFKELHTDKKKKGKSFRISGRYLFIGKIPVSN